MGKLQMHRPLIVMRPDETDIKTVISNDNNYVVYLYRKLEIGIKCCLISKPYVSALYSENKEALASGSENLNAYFLDFFLEHMQNSISHS